MDRSRGATVAAGECIRYRKTMRTSSLVSQIPISAMRPRRSNSPVTSFCFSSGRFCVIPWVARQPHQPQHFTSDSIEHPNLRFYLPSSALSCCREKSLMPLQYANYANGKFSKKRRAKRNRDVRRILQVCDVFLIPLSAVTLPVSALKAVAEVPSTAKAVARITSATCCPGPTPGGSCVLTCDALKLPKARVTTRCTCCRRTFTDFR